MLNDVTITATDSDPVWDDGILVINGGNGEPDVYIEGSKAEIQGLIDSMRRALRDAR